MQGWLLVILSINIIIERVTCFEFDRYLKGGGACISEWLAICFYSICYYIELYVLVQNLCAAGPVLFL